ncbi:cell division protein zapa [Lucifera butyrica]|uniref:Cell division protein ZapA n=1 Tax=Lucifera butyrica TaxID=1351585 RepID=A0A498RCY0_9FIRM|nr:cell division protein zapa [Lucifera butyrica]
MEIFGETYPVKGDVEAERILQAAALLDDKMKKIAKTNPLLSSARIAVLAALNIADEYLRLDQDYQQLMQMVKDAER